MLEVRENLRCAENNTSYTSPGQTGHQNKLWKELVPVNPDSPFSQWAHSTQTCFEFVTQVILPAKNN